MAKSSNEFSHLGKKKSYSGKNGNNLGTSNKSDDIWGDKVDFFDANGKRIATSRNESNIFGDYKEIRDDNNKVIGYKTLEIGIGGKYYSIRDINWKEINRVDFLRDFSGDEIEEYENDTIIPQKSSWQSSSSDFSSGYSGGSSGGSSGSDKDMDWITIIIYLSLIGLVIYCIIFFLIPILILNLSIIVLLISLFKDRFKKFYYYTSIVCFLYLIADFYFELLTFHLMTSAIMLSLGVIELIIFFNFISFIISVVLLYKETFDDNLYYDDDDYFEDLKKIKQKKKQTKTLNLNGLDLNTKTGQTLKNVNFGLFLFHQSKYFEAIESFTEAIKINKNSVDSYFFRSYSYFFLGNYFEALSDLEIVKKLNRNYRNLDKTIGLINFKVGNYKLAIEHLTYHLNYSSEDKDCLCKRGIAYAKTENIELAFQDFKKARLLGSSEAMRLIHIYCKS